MKKKIIRFLSSLLWGSIIIGCLVLMGFRECRRVNGVIHGYELKEF